jgi:DNA-binding CsgD family transcriptional regulator
MYPEYDQRGIEAFASLKLTSREAQVLFWISQGKSNHDIGVILGAKTGTICKHVEHIFWQAQRRKSHGCCSDGSRNLQLRRAGA